MRWNDYLAEGNIKVGVRFRRRMRTCGVVGCSRLGGGTAATGLVGGLASVAGGGKFENGAVTAAFGYLYNELGGYT